MDVSALVAAYRKIKADQIYRSLGWLPAPASPPAWLCAQRELGVAGKRVSTAAKVYGSIFIGSNH